MSSLTTISYHSGRIAVSLNRYEGGGKGVYTLVYEDCEQSPLIAYFTPSGIGGCYYHSGALRMLFNKEGGTLFDEVQYMQYVSTCSMSHKLFPLEISFSTVNAISLYVLSWY